MKLITNYFPKPQPTEQDGQSQPAQQHVEQPQPPSEGQDSPQPEQRAHQPVQPQFSTVGQGSPQPEHHDVQQSSSQPVQSQGGQGQSSPQLRGIEALKKKRYVSQKIDCPRCGNPGRMYITKRGKREYIYVKHHDKKDCYIGPMETYVVVQKVLGHLALKGLDSINYAEVVASAAEKMIEQIEKAMEENDKRRIDEIIDAMIDIAYVIRDACHTAGERRPHCLEEVARVLFS